MEGKHRYIKNDTIEYMTGCSFESELLDIRRIYPHYHEADLEIVFCLEGEVSFVSGNERNTLHAGDLYTFDHGDIHYLHSDVENTTLVCHIDIQRVHVPWERVEHALFACESTHCLSHQQEAMKQVKDHILCLALEPDSRRLTDALFDILLEKFSWYGYDNQDDYINHELYDRFYRVLRYCEEHLEEKISARMLSERVHINYNYFSQFFMRTSFGNFSNLVKYFRCHKAEHLLLETDLPNGEIAFRCGFSDQKRFYRAFRQIWGRTPFEHRKAYRAYMEKDMKVVRLESSEAEERIGKFIIGWHMEKVKG